MRPLKRAICMIETSSIPVGMQAADAMAKAAVVELLRAQTICPGRYMVLAAGDVGAVEAALRAARAVAGRALTDAMALANLHESLIAILAGGRAAPITQGDAVGVVEIKTTPSTILAADAAVKSGAVRLVRIRLAQGMAAKSLFTVTGDVAAVQTAVAAGEAVARGRGHLHSSVVLPSPHPSLWPFLA